LRQEMAILRRREVDTAHTFALMKRVEEAA